MPSPTNLAEQYELGDAASHDAAPEPAAAPVSPTESQPAAVQSEVGNNQPPASSPPSRNPDGTFAKQSHSTRLVEMARDFGMEEADIALMPAMALETVVHKLYKQQQELFRQHSIQATIQQPPSSAAVPAPAGGPPGSPAPESGLGINEADYDPGLMGVLKKLHQANAELRSELVSLKAAHQQSAQLTFNEQCDVAFAKHESVMGKGNRSDLPDDSPFLARRMAILSLVKTLPQKGTLQSRIDQAVQTLYGTQVAPAPTPVPAPQPATGRVTEEQWRAGTLAKPTHRRPDDEAPGVEKAKKSVAAKLDEMNGASAKEPESLDDFLGK